MFSKVINTVVLSLLSSGPLCPYTSGAGWQPRTDPRLSLEFDHLKKQLQVLSSQVYDFISLLLSRSTWTEDSEPPQCKAWVSQLG